MRILLLQPKTSPLIVSLGNFEPLGLELIAGALSEHDVRIFDYRFEKSLTAELRRFQPELLGVTGFSTDYGTMCAALREAHHANPGLPLIVGGFHASMVPADFAGIPGVRFAVLGLGHRTLPEALTALAERNETALKDIPGLAIFDGQGGMHVTAPRAPESSLESLPAPRRDLCERHRKRYHPAFYFHTVGVTISSLGCPYRCSFCSSWKLNQGRYLERSPEAFVNDLLRIPQKHVFVGDDNFLHNTDRAWQIVRLLEAAGCRKRFVSYARVDTIVKNPELMAALKRVGLIGLIVGYEAVTDARLKAYHKGTTAAMNREAVQILARNKIFNEAQLVISQDFTKTDFEQMYKLLDEWGVWRPRLTLLTPVPGTDFFDKTKHQLTTREPAFFDYTHCVLPTEGMPQAEFLAEYRRLWIRLASLRRYVRHAVLLALNTLRGSGPGTEVNTINPFYALFMRFLVRRWFVNIQAQHRQWASLVVREPDATTNGFGEDGVNRDQAFAKL